MSVKELDSTFVVQKYGGTSLGKLLDIITGTIVPRWLLSDKVVVVCSARSGTSKTTGTTKLLLEATDHATNHSINSEERLDTVINLIRDEHLNTVESAVVNAAGVSDEALCQKLKQEIIEDSEAIRKFLHAAHTVGELSPRSQDRVLAVGEALSCRITAAALESKGIAAEVVLLNHIVDEAYPDPSHGPEKTYDELGTQFFDGIAQQIGERIVACGNRVPVVTGFFGKMPTGLLQSVGRGYSDLCAAMCAVGVGARELQIWKEVDGVFTADPGKVQSARLLPTITSEEASELTYFGSEVIHPLTVEQIQKSSVPLRLKNATNPNGAGTVVLPTVSGTSTPSSAFMISNGYHGGSGELQYRRTPTAMTVKDSIIIINVLSHRNSKSHGFLAKIFEQLDRSRLVVDLVTTSEKSVSLAVSSATEQASDIKTATAEIGKLGNVSVTSGMSIVSVVGHNMRNMVGIAGEVFQTLASDKINIYLISQGASQINISFVVKEEDALLAMNSVHAKVLKIPALSEQQSKFSAGPWFF